MRVVLRKGLKRARQFLKRWPSSWRWAVAFLLGLAILLFLILPNPAELKSKFPVVIYQGAKKPFKVTVQNTKPKDWIYIGDVSKFALGAVLMNEDSAFYSHEGFDPVQMKEALIEDLEKGKFARGASTITQQVVKNVYLKQHKTIIRKLSELWLAVRLDQELSKNRILEIYLNIAEWGEGIFGIQEASYYYFKKHPSQLTPKEASFLGILLPSPKKYSQSFRQKSLTRFARKSIERTLKKMVQSGYLHPDRLRQEMIAQLSFEQSPTVDEKGLDEDEEITYEPDPDAK